MEMIKSGNKIISNEYSYVVSILDDQNNPSDNLDNFSDLYEAIACAKEHQGAGVFQERYLTDKNICEYLLVWHPAGEPKPEDVINLSKLVYDQQMVDWKLTVEGYAELNQADKDIARGIISEAIKEFNIFEGIFSITKDEEDNYPRTCSHCGKGMHAGYCINSGEKYYCSDECLHEHYTEEEYLEMYDDGNGDSYWTEWEILDVVKQLNKKEREGK